MESKTPDNKNPRALGGDGSGIGFLLGIILIIVLLVLFFVYGLGNAVAPGEDLPEDMKNNNRASVNE